MPPHNETLTAAQRAVERAYRDHYRALVAPLIRIVGSFEAAEDAVQDAFSRALPAWTRDGVPDVPLAWLRRAARNRALDVVRSRTRWRDREDAIARDLEDTLLSAESNDDTLRLLFTCCHPSLSPDARVGLTLRTVCGLTSEQVARAFLIQRTTLQQRLVRARQKIDRAGIRYAVPDEADLPPRLSTVLRTIYLVFNEGYGASDGEALARRPLCDEAIRLARLVVKLMPNHTEPAGLLALLLLHHARYDARTNDDGDLVTLEEQDRDLYDRRQIDEALPLVERALAGRPLSRYAVEAAIAALHSNAPSADATDWEQIAGLYRVLRGLTRDQPIVVLNHAVAVAMAGQMERGRSMLAELRNEPSLSGYHLLAAAEGDLARRAGDADAAAAAYADAIARTENGAERRYLQRRLAALAASTKKDRP